MCPHLVDGVLPRFHSYVGQDAVFWVEELAEALEEEHVGAEFSLVFVLHAKKHVIVALGGPIISLQV